MRGMPRGITDYEKTFFPPTFLNGFWWVPRFERAPKRCLKEKGALERVTACIEDREERDTVAINNCVCTLVL